MRLFILTLIRLLDILVPVLGLALILRVVLPWFKVSRAHPVMRFLLAVTEPFVRPVRESLGSGSVRWVRGGYVDLAPLVTIFVIWLTSALLTQLLGWILVPPLWFLRPGANLERWLISVINLLVQVYMFSLLLRMFLEWLRTSYSTKLMRFLWTITEPLLAPIRRRLPTFAGVDFSPVILIVLISLAQMLLTSLIRAVV